MRHTATAVLLMGLAACDRAPAPQPAPSVAHETPTITVAPSEKPKLSLPTTLAIPERFTALGTEPFWAAKVDGDRLTYTTPEDQTGQSVEVSRSATADAAELSGTLAGKPLVVTLTKGPCSDGMSDTVYPFSVVRKIGDDVQRGCAREQ